MSAKTTRGLAAVDLLEEAVQVLRCLPPEAFGIYYVGSLPFVLGFLYFWADMSHGAFAYSYCMPDALFVSALFVWMKGCQAAFATQVRAHVCLEDPPGWSAGRMLRLLSVQTAIQPTGLILLPLAGLLMLPFGWTYAFYQNLSLFGDGQEIGFSAPFRKSARNAGLLPAQNHLIIAIMIGFGFFVTIDIALALYLVPHLTKMLFGIETTMTMLGVRALNTTFLALVFAIAYLVLDPLAKTVYVLRCYYGESLKNGEDLRVRLKAITAGTKKITVVPLLFVLLSVVVPANVTAAESAQNMRRGVDKVRMERSIEKILSRREFSWRMPRQKSEKTDRPAAIQRFLSDACNTVATWLRPLKQWALDFIRWLAKYLSAWKGQQEQMSGNNNWEGRVKALVYFMLCLAAAALLAIIFKLLRAPKAGPLKPQVPPVRDIPDMEDELVKADDLPENEWMRIARGFIADGNNRPALRALYLAALSHLAERKFVFIELSKSNRDYERELRRRTPSAVRLHEAFAQNSRIFERAWYGLHEVTKEALDTFINNHERILSFAEGS